MKHIVSKIWVLFLILSIAFVACSTPEKQAPPVSTVEHPEWSKAASIYEVNIRQYSPEGTFNAFSNDLPRIQAMGVDIIWLMPIHPIGLKNRKETEESLGSYYSVQNYKKVNPNFGTEEDFRTLVKQAHELGLKVIIDWVANHSAWDNPWTENPDWYELDEEGNFTPPRGTDWTDVIQLNYENEDMRAAMLDALEYWVREFDIDGYRSDVAGMVPTDFWVNAHESLDQIKDVFMLAEDGEPELLIDAFDMNYAWEYAHVIREIAKGEQTFDDLDALFARDAKRFPANSYRMYFTSNHDENSWNGTDTEMYGDNFQNFAVLSATVPGMPLIYNGQESGLDKQLKFFEKDEIEWKDYKYEDFYRLLLTLKEENEALWNGAYGGELTRVKSPDGTYAFTRTKGQNEVIVAINNNNTEQIISVPVWASANYSKYGVLEGEFSSDGSETYEFTLPANKWFILATSN
jgi:glycosidase